METQVNEIAACAQRVGVLAGVEHGIGPFLSRHLVVEFACSCVPEKTYQFGERLGLYFADIRTECAGKCRVGLRRTRGCTGA